MAIAETGPATGKTAATGSRGQSGDPQPSHYPGARLVVGREVRGGRRRPKVELNWHLGFVGPRLSRRERSHRVDRRLRIREQVGKFAFRPPLGPPRTVSRPTTNRGRPGYVAWVGGSPD